MRTQRKFNEWRVENGALVVDISTNANPSTLALISLEDSGVVSDGRGRWAARRVGRQVYVSRRRNGKVQYLHRLLLEAELSAGDLVDHINGDGLDNRRDNLRISDRSTNAKNCRKSSANTTGFVGVSHDKRYGVYYAGLIDKGEYVYCGTFKNAEQAAAARLLEQSRRGFTDRHGSPQ